jgi:hypothetical protein
LFQDMMKRLLERLRGARGIEWFAALALAALLALMLLRPGSGDGVRREASPLGPGTPLEARVERILQCIEGAGRVSAMITQGEDGAVTGAVIVAEGLSDVQTYLRLQRAVSALLDVEADRIEIIGGSGAFS